jgi:hypothetical protein
MNSLQSTKLKFWTNLSKTESLTPGDGCVITQAVNGGEFGGLALIRLMPQLRAWANDDGPDMGGSCSSHDDYIWKVEAGTTGKDRGKVGISVYFSCKATEEARADEIVKENFAPVYDKLVEDGKLASWGWQSHVVGGWFRRLYTMTAADFETLMAARAEALATTYAEDNEAGAEFAGICGGHQDYLWGIVHETRASD